MPEQPLHPSSSIPEAEPRVNLKTPGLAALLSWAVPGAGQIYQGRYFKGVLFFVCILGTFFFGIRMGEGRPVYTTYFVSNEGQTMQKRNFGYLSQFLVGVSSLPAILQAKRFDADDNDWKPQKPINASFKGALTDLRGAEFEQKVTGNISLELKQSPLGLQLQGRLIGKLDETGEPVDLELIESFHEKSSYPLDLEISADPKRHVVMQIQNVVTGPVAVGNQLTGSIPRPFMNWYQVPLQDYVLQDLNERLGKRWELAMVLTWIAGLLNILVIWDAFEGPAYGIRPRLVPEKPKNPETT